MHAHPVSLLPSRRGRAARDRRAAARSRCATGAVILLLLTSLSSVAQRRGGEAEFAFTSRAGTWVYCGPLIASPAHPVGDTAGYRIERRSSGGAWSPLADVASVTTVEELRGRVGAARLAALAKAMKASGEAELWSAILAAPRLESVPVASDRALLVALGMLYCDSTATTGGTYEYRVSVLLVSGQTVRPKTSAPLKAGTPWAMGSMLVTRVEETDSSCVIEWAAPLVRPFPQWVRAYRRMTGREEYRRLDRDAGLSVRHDSVVCTISDHGLARNQQYEYYLEPENLFGDLAPASQTAAIFTVNFSRLPLPQKLRAERALNGILLSWSTEGKDVVLATRIYRSAQFDSGYALLAEVPAAQSSYIDQSAEGMTRYYYRLTNVSYRNRESQRSGVVFGYWETALPPATPQHLAATPRTGGAELRWNANTEADLAGYYVCRSASATDSLLPVSPLLASPRFVDTSLVLKGGVRYRYAVQAVNTSRKKSQYSIPVWVKPIIPTSPPPPRSLYASARENGIALNWSDPRDMDPAVIGYGLYRAEPDPKGPRFALLARIGPDPDILNYLDSSALPGRSYLYAVTSIDAAGGEGIRSMTAEARIGLDLLLPPADLHASAAAGKVRLEWEETQDGRIAAHAVYRYERGKQPAKIATVPASAHEYTDAKVKKGTVYYYQLAAVDKAGKEGPKGGAVYAVP